MTTPLPLGRYFPDSSPAQAPADVAVVMPTLMRPIAVRAIESVYAQDFQGRIQIVIGADVNPGDTGPIFAALERRPGHVSAAVLTLPYSTSERHGGVHRAYDGGALRTILTFMANARRVAYLDDDNEWTPDHLSLLIEAMGDKAWAHSLRLCMDEDTDEELGVDIWDAVGPNKGRFKDIGGVIDPNTLMIDKVRAAPILWMWSDPGPNLKRLEADRRITASLGKAPGGFVEKATVRYRMRRTNILWQFMREGTRFD
ncbi:MAG: hypothetical protein JNL41_14120 [Phenylobacterium sp.]|uniref:hypothetical protein n=1 Tax=Phenylobacterium sp. TaxID=1871053 RepID=UPI001A40AF49|nr:hypothetical protein [Phenylobacterium sp.]MBL8555406.1 hypothetical protein [Phenylobacterium sp.]